MGINFPPTPAVGTLYPTVYVPGQAQYRWDGEKWTTSAIASGKRPVYDDGTVPMLAQLGLVGDPVGSNDAARKAYVDAGDAAAIAGISSQIDTQITNKAVRYDAAQTLTAAQKKQVAANTGLNKGLFHVNRAGTNQASSGGGIAQIQFNNKLVDANNWYSTSTFRYQPTEPGWFFFYLAAIPLGAPTSAETAQPTIRKIGAAYQLGNYLGVAGIAGNSFFANGCALVDLNGSTDYVDFATWVPSGCTGIVGSADRTFAFGWKIGEL